MSWKLTLEDIDKYKSAFSTFDHDNKGYISIPETKKLLRSLGQSFTEQRLREITDKVINEHHEKVELYVFLDLMANNRQNEENNDNLLNAFKYFEVPVSDLKMKNSLTSKDISGKIVWNDFAHTLRYLNHSKLDKENLSDQEINKLKEYINVDKKTDLFDYPALLNKLIDK